LELFDRSKQNKSGKKSEKKAVFLLVIIVFSVILNTVNFIFYTKGTRL